MTQENSAQFYEHLHLLFVEQFDHFKFNYCNFDLIDEQNITYDISPTFKPLSQVECKKEKFLEHLKVLINNKQTFKLETNKPLNDDHIIEKFFDHIYHLAPSQFQYTYENFFRIYDLVDMIEAIYKLDANLLPKFLTYHHGLLDYQSTGQYVLSALNILANLDDNDNWSESYHISIKNSLLVFFEKIKDAAFFTNTTRSGDNRYDKNLREDEQVFFMLKAITGNKDIYEFLPYFPQFPLKSNLPSSLYNKESNALTKIEFFEDAFFSRYDAIFTHADAKEACNFIAKKMAQYTFPEIKSVHFISDNVSDLKKLENNEFYFIVHSNSHTALNIDLIEHVISSLIEVFNEDIKIDDDINLNENLNNDHRWQKIIQKLVLEYCLINSNHTSKRLKL